MSLPSQASIDRQQSAVAIQDALADESDNLELERPGIQVLDLRLDQLPKTRISLGLYTRIYRYGDYALRSTNSKEHAVAGFTMAVAARDCAVHHYALLLIDGRVNGSVMELGTAVSPETTGLIRADISKQLLKVVNDLHAMDIVHGDIKLANFIHCKDGKIRLNDFKIARFSNDLREERSMSVPWCSPHIVGGDDKPRTARDDLYSLGVTIWEVYAGRTPYTSPGADIHTVSDEDVRDEILSGARLDMSEITDLNIRELAEELIEEHRHG